MTGSESVDASCDYPVLRDRAGMLLPTRRVGRSVAEVARDHECDRVMFGAAAPLGLLARGLRERAGIRHVTVLTHGHEVWWARVPVARQLLRRICDDADVITYVSEFCRQQIAPALSAQARQRMRLLTPTVDASRFHALVDGSGVRRELGLGVDDTVVLSASRLVRRKGQDVLIKAWPHVLAREPMARLVIVGDGPSSGRLHRAVRRSGLQERVTFVSAVPWSEMPAMYAMADVFALPCRTRLWGLEPEAFGLVFLEAAATGLPVLVGDSGGAVEAARSARTKVVVSGRDPRAVGAGLLRLLETIA
jgi:phosphatidylinositol alpha-1,6-mannosyltransferase